MNNRLTIVIGADDAGEEMKNLLRSWLEKDARVESLIDVGVNGGEATAYPHIGVEAARRVAAREADRALLVCGTGLGMAISANKVPGIRAVTAHDPYSVERSVLSNNAQVLCFGARVISAPLAMTLLDPWLDHRFDEDSPSSVKVAAITSYESAT